MNCDHLNIEQCCNCKEGFTDDCLVQMMFFDIKELKQVNNTVTIFLIIESLNFIFGYMEEDLYWFKECVEFYYPEYITSLQKYLLLK